MLSFVESFFKVLEEERIRYVHWKSNLNLHNALLGEDDLDILVHPDDKTGLYCIFRELSVIRGYSEKDVWQSDVLHFYGLDEETRIIVHIHLHFALPVGYDYNKNFVLPVVDDVFKTKMRLHNVFVTKPEYEYIILVIRILIKNGITPFLLSSPSTQFRLLRTNKIVSGNALREFEDLRQKIDWNVIEDILRRSLPEISYEFFIRCEAVIAHNNSLWDFLTTARQLKTKLRKYRTNNEVYSFLVSFFRINKNRFLKVYNKIFSSSFRGSKSPEFGGRIFAFIGGDGGGKSTNIKILKKNLEKTFKTSSLHIGKPPKSLIGYFLYSFSKGLILLGLKNQGDVFMYLRLAIDRNKAFKKALKLRQQGVIVILDRFPLPEITAMDHPRIDAKRFPRLARYEKKKYQIFDGVDLMFIMKLDPEIALKRRPEDNPDQLRNRSGQIWNRDWEKMFQVVCDTGFNSFEYIEQLILINVWKSLTTEFIRTEVIGISGCGKSTTTRKLKDEYNNIQFRLTIREFPKMAIILAAKKPSYITVLLNRKQTSLRRKLEFYVDFYKLFAKTEAKQVCIKPTNLIMDQGIIFFLILGYKERIFSKEFVVQTLNEFEEFFHDIIYLHAPIETSFERIKNRPDQGIGRAKDMSFNEFTVFYTEYLDAFNLLEETKLEITKINTAEFSPLQVVESIKSILGR